MSGFFQQFLQGAVNGFLGSPNLKDYTHASKTFVGNHYQNAPKFKWLFHVYFDINYSALSDSNIQAALPPTTNLGLMVKSVELPKFNMQLTELNQYNRKRHIQTKVNYQPIRVTFHDDNADQIRQLWSTYFAYHYYDMTNPRDQSTNGEDWAVTQMNGKNTYTNSLPADQRNWGFNGDFTNGTTSSVFNSSKPSFFKSIRIYGFNQHNFSEYVLINPMIDAFDHDTYSYSETSGTMEHNMTIKYETVKYYTGALNGQKPGDIVKGFGDPSVYDTEMSPIGKPGTNKSIMGQGGLVDSVDGIIKDVTSGNILGAIQTAGRVAKTFKNPQQILQAAKTELTAGVIAATPGIVRSNFNFPSMGSTVGSGSQQAKQNLAPVETITPVPVNNNNPI